jgi:mgtE-like transporter
VKKRNALLAAEEELLKFVKPKVPKRTYREFEEILVIEFISVTGGVIAGAMLAQWLDKIALVPGLLILLPGFLAMRGNISGSLAARIGAALHLGLLKHRNHRHFIHVNAVAAFTLSIMVAVFLGIVAFGATWLFFGVRSTDIILVALIASVISNIILIPLTTRTAVWLFRKGHDPDNIMGPYITTVGDIVSVASLILAVVLV